MAREIELKLDVEAGSGDRIRGAALVQGVEPRLGELNAIYFDSKAGLLRRAGYSLRIRRSGERFIQTVKKQEGGAAGLFDRPEWECDVHGFKIDFDAIEETPLGELLTKKHRKALVPLIRADVTRTTWLLGEDGMRAELTLDEGTVAGGDAETKVAEVEIELIEGEPSALFGIADEIAKTAPVRIGVLSKSERGYRLADGALAKAVKAEPLQLTRGMSVAEGFSAIAYSCLRQFRLNEDQVLATRDPAALHQARVAMRRLRSAFSLFGSVIEDAEYEALRQELRWFTAQLGDARNMDVFMKRLPEGEAKRPEGEEEVRKKLTRSREEAYARVMEALRSERLRGLMLRLLRWIETGRWRSGRKAAKPLLGFAERQLGKRWRKVRERGADLAGLDPEPRHRLRIDIKKMRYAAEFLAGLHTSEAALAGRKRFLDALEELQDQLGELNDAQTARELVATLPLSKGAETRFAETLIGREADPQKCLAAAEKAYGRFREAGEYWTRA